MARPPLQPGTYGTIHVFEDGDQWCAETRFRRRNGTYARPRRWRPTRTKAINALKEHLLELADEATAGQVRPESRFRDVAQLWVAELVERNKHGDLADNSLRAYRRSLQNWVMPALGELRMRELDVRTTEDVVKRARAERSYETAAIVRVVISGVCRHGVRHGAMTADPTKSFARLARGETKQVRALTLAERKDLLAKLTAFGKRKQTDARGHPIGRRGQIWRDLPDIMVGMLSTGERLGELLAHDGDNVNPSGPTVDITHHLIVVEGQGIVRKAKRKGGEPELVLRVPEWSVPMWRRKKLASGGGPLFRSYSGQFYNPVNVIPRIRTAMDECGYDWVTSHVFRKTVAAVLDEAGLPTNAIADQLGNTPAVAERHYRPRRAANQQQADALESML